MMRNGLIWPYGIVFVLMAASGNSAHGDSPQIPLLANGSFEDEGQTAPRHWKLDASAAWVKVTLASRKHRGRMNDRCLRLSGR
jgi:hypothetical protein